MWFQRNRSDFVVFLNSFQESENLGQQSSLKKCNYIDHQEEEKILNRI